VGVPGAVRGEASVGPNDVSDIGIIQVTQLSPRDRAMRRVS